MSLLLFIRICTKMWRKMSRENVRGSSSFYESMCYYRTVMWYRKPNFVRLPYYEDVIGTKPGTGVASSSQRKLSDVGYQTNHLSVSDVYRVESCLFYDWFTFIYSFVCLFYFILFYFILFYFILFFIYLFIYLFLLSIYLFIYSFIYSFIKWLLTLSGSYLSQYSS